MRKFLVFLSVLGVCVVLGPRFDGVKSAAEAGGKVEKCAAVNGDVNADDAVDLSDAITVLGYLFSGSPTELVPLCATPGIPELEAELAECRAGNCPGLPDTGQTLCHDTFGNEIDCTSDAFAGQDGSYRTGCPGEGRFVDNGDGTVTDTCTGLMWQRDTGFARNWLKWSSALAYCEELDFAGHTDWRLPSIRELQSLIDFGRHDPAIDPVFGAESSFYWSSTSRAERRDYAWYVNFEQGLANRFVKAEVSFVRAVRTAR